MNMFGNKNSIEDDIKKYVALKDWSLADGLAEFQNILRKTLSILVRLRSESKDIKKGKEDSKETPFRKFDDGVFDGQLKELAAQSNDYTLDNLPGDFKCKDPCLFKNLTDSLSNLEQYYRQNSPNVVTTGIEQNNKAELLKKFNWACISVKSVLKHSNAYVKSSHFRILRRVRLRKQFFEKFVKLLESLKSWMEKIKNELEKKELNGVLVAKDEVNTKTPEKKGGVRNFFRRLVHRKVPEDTNAESNAKVNEELKKKWKEGKLEGNQKKKSLLKIITEANEAHEKLQNRGLLPDKDNVASSRSGAGFSKNFVKLFIRYLERSFPELKDCVKIYYFASGGFSSGSLRKNINNYWKKIKKFVKKSKNDGMIYFIVNQAANIGPDVSKKGGHANLTIVCNGSYKVFETVPNNDNISSTIGTEDYNKKKINMASYYEEILDAVKIQADEQNCVTIALGYVESLMKQIAKNKEEWSKTSEKSKKAFSEHVSDAINKYSVVTLPDSVKDPGRKPLKMLLPSKYIRYLQTRTGRDKLIDIAKSMKEGDENYAIMKEVADELVNVKTKYDLKKMSVKDFLTFLKSKGWNKFPSVKDLLSNEYSVFARDSSVADKVTLDTCINQDILKPADPEDGKQCFSLGNKKLVCNSKEVYGDPPVPGRVSNGPIIKTYEKSTTEWQTVTHELSENKIYKLICKNPENDINKELLEKLEAWRSKIDNVVSHAGPMESVAQFKRRKEMLKVSALVDTLDDNGIDVEDEIRAVDTI